MKKECPNTLPMSLCMDLMENYARYKTMDTSKAIESFIHLLGHISVIVLVHSAEYFVDVSFLAKELLKGQSSIRVFVKNLEEPIYLSPK